MILPVETHSRGKSFNLVIAEIQPNEKWQLLKQILGKCGYDISFQMKVLCEKQKHVLHPEGEGLFPGMQHRM